MPANPHLAKHDAPIATAAAMTPDTDLPGDFIGGHRNTYLTEVKCADGEYRHALMVVELDLQDLSQPGVAILRYTAFAHAYGGNGQRGHVGQVFATGTFPAPVDADLSDSNLHCYAGHLISMPDQAVPTVEQVSEMIILGRLTRATVREFPAYCYEVLLDRLQESRCAHEYRLTDSCPSCDVELETV